ncbi:MAG: hypothetical protein GY700_06535 [Propionibacteriaceae bacterium]|nr:hypothetical protein [Propionibacteriaceae bacterium]
MTTKYHEITIAPHHSGFGMWQAGIPCGLAWDDADDLLTEIIASFPGDVYELGIAELPSGVTNICGSIYDEPSRVFALVADEDDAVTYCGIDEVTS